MTERRAGRLAGLAPALPAAAVLLAGLCAGRGAALAGVAALAPGVVLAAPRLVPGGVSLGEGRTRWLTALGAAAGVATVAPVVSGFAMVALVVTVAFLVPRLPHHPAWPAAALAMLCAAFTLAVHSGGMLPATALAMGIQAGLGLVIALAATAESKPAPGGLQIEDGTRRLLAPALCAGACAAGLADLPGAGLASAAVVVAYALWAAEGLAEGTLAGAAAGLAAGAALGPAIPAVGAAAFGGAAAGFFRRRSAWAWPIAGVAGNCLAAILSAQPAWGWTAGAVLGATAAAVAIARRTGPDRAPADMAGAGEMAALRLAATIVERLRASAEACMALGRDLAVSPLVAGGGQPDLDAGLHIADQVCPGCPALSACWERKLPKARRMVGDLLQAAQSGPVTWRQVGGADTIHCLRPREMAEAANRVAALGRQRDEFLRVLAQSRRSVLSPLVGIGRHLADLAQQAAAAVEPPMGAAPLRDFRSPVAERWAGTPAADGLAFDAVVASLSRPGRSVSGDTTRCRTLRGDRLALVLSDGMGSGEPAAVISAGAAEHLLACLAAGRSAMDALRQTNEQMVADGGTERFATLDLVLVHLNSGLLEWYKMGAPPGLLVHPRGVRELTGGGLPAGILPVPEIRSGRVRLRPGDTAVLVSDGVLERPAGLLAASDRGARVHWAADWLGQHARQTSPLGIARGLLDAARRRIVDGDHDDLTVLVCTFHEAAREGRDVYAAQQVAGTDPSGGT